MILIAEHSHIITKGHNKFIQIMGVEISLNNMIVREETALVCEYYMLHYKSSNKDIKFEEFLENIVKKSSYRGVVIIGSHHTIDWQTIDAPIYWAHKMSVDDAHLVKYKIEV
jgi:hypothetical protein